MLQAKDHLYQYRHHFPSVSVFVEPNNSPRAHLLRVENNIRERTGVPGPVQAL